MVDSLMHVRIPDPLRSYTAGAAVVSAEAATLSELVWELDHQYPGLRFRIIDEQGGIRRHIKFFVNGLQTRDLQPTLREHDEVMIVCALSGG